MTTQQETYLYVGQDEEPLGSVLETETITETAWNRGLVVNQRATGYNVLVHWEPDSAKRITKASWLIGQSGKIVDNRSGHEYLIILGKLLSVNPLPVWYYEDLPALELCFSVAEKESNP